MEIAKSARAENVEPQKRPVDTKLDEYGPGAEPECARAMAEARRVLCELSLAASCTRRSNPRRSSSVDEEPSEHSLVSARSGRPQPAPPPPVDRLRLDPDLDFVIHDDGVIELTEAGLRRMVQAHSAGFDVVIGIHRREVLRLPASALVHDPLLGEGYGSSRCAAT
jgi:hypothetical protein